MPKLQNVTEAEIEAVRHSFDDPIFVMYDLTMRIEKGYCDDLKSAVTHARDFAVLARAANNLAVHLLVRVASQEQKAELDTLLRERAELEKAK